MRMSLRVAVAGCTGYAGGEVLRLLLTHPEVEIGALTAGSSAGSHLGEHQRHLSPLAEREIIDTTVDNLRGHDVVFLALPHATSGPIAAELDESCLVIDCGADFRLEDAGEWEHFYGTPHAGTWPYGLPELPGQREVIATSKRVAVPGCYPTGSTLALLPALTAGLIDGHDVVVVAASGTSGAGKAAKPHLLGSEVMGSVMAYGVGGAHRHTPEILQNMRRLGATDPSLSFTPTLVPMPRGILSTVTAPITGTTTEQAQQAYAEAYAEEPFVQVLAPGTWPATSAVVGSNMVHLQVAVDERAGRLVVVSALDNLTKGTAGGAIQSMNIACGLPETTGLPMIGVAP